LNDWTAVIIACGHAKMVKGRPAPLSRIAGMTVLARTIKCVRHLKARACRLVLSEEDSETLGKEAQVAWGSQAGLTIIKLGKACAHTDAIRAASDDRDQQLVVFFADTAFSINLLQGLLNEGLQDSAGLAATGEAERFPGREEFHKALNSSGDRFAGLILLDAQVAKELPPGKTLPDELSRMVAQGQVRLRSMNNSFTWRIMEPADVSRAESRQVRALRRNGDGLISRWLNRPVSLLLSRFIFCRLPLTPNHITFIAGLIGWAAILLMFLWPGYWWVLLGAFLFHVSSVLDGCDGEVARLRFQFSRFGEWFDNVLDEVNNSLFIAGIGVGIWRMGGNDIYLWASLFHLAAVTILDSATFYQLIRWRGGTGNIEKMRYFFQGEETKPVEDPTAYPSRRSLAEFAMQLVRRDFYIFLLLVLACFDRLYIGFWISIGAAVILFVLGIIQWGWQLSGGPDRVN